MTVQELMNEIVNGKSIKEVLEMALSSQKPSDAHIIAAKYLGKNIFTRTVTHHYTGKLTAVNDGFMVLENAAWIADDGVFSVAMSGGVFDEIEPFPDGEILVAIGSIVDISEYKFPLPRTKK